jgi:hypothetical protein
VSTIAVTIAAQHGETNKLKYLCARVVEQRVMAGSSPWLKPKLGDYGCAQTSPLVRIDIM